MRKYEVWKLHGYPYAKKILNKKIYIKIYLIFSKKKLNLPNFLVILQSFLY